MKAIAKITCKYCAEDLVFSVFDGRNWNGCGDVNGFESEHMEKHYGIESFEYRKDEFWYDYFVTSLEDEYGNPIDLNDETHWDNAYVDESQIGEPYTVTKTNAPINEFTKASYFKDRG
jgi:hypothetical protein